MEIQPYYTEDGGGDEGDETYMALSKTSYGGYYEASETGGDGYADSFVSSQPGSPTTGELPLFMRPVEPVMSEAQKTKAFHMQYHKSPLMGIVAKGMETRVDEQGSWNERFQHLMDMDDCFEKYDRLRSMAHDFVHAAEAYGRIIISEMCLPDTAKTIKPTAIGGIAGGQKFIVQDILFKFAVDFEGLYGGDAFAMKAAGHDISGLMAYLNAIQTQPTSLQLLHVPLMALIDFRGYRVIAICLLPIGRDSICYGSYDAGKTVHYEYPECNEAMRRVGNFMNIRGHRSAKFNHLLYAPIDIEAHKGRDGKFYVLDFARYMPPQPPSGKWGGTLYELLRPELVRSSPVPLSPDAYSSFGHPDDAKEGRQHIRDLFATLKKPEPGGVIFDYAQLIDSEEKTESEINSHSFRNIDPKILVANNLQLQEVIVREMHVRGINMRFLGLLRSFCTRKEIRSFILQQCVARMWKGEAQHLWRDVMQDQRTVSEEPFLKISAAFFNTLVSSSGYWKTLKARLTEKYPEALSTEEQSDEFDLQSKYPNLLFMAFSQLLIFLNVELERGTLSSFERYCETRTWPESKDSLGFTFVAGDIINISCRTKHISTVDKADAYAHMYQAEFFKKDPGTASRLLNLALAKLLTAMKTTGTDLELQYKLCICRLKLVTLEAKNGQRPSFAPCRDTISAFIKKLEGMSGSSLLPQAKLLLAKLNFYDDMRSAEKMLTNVVPATLDVLDSFCAQFPRRESKNSMIAFLPFIKQGVVCSYYMNSRGYFSRDYEFARTFLQRLIDECRILYSCKAVKESHPVVMFWLWWLLVLYGKYVDMDDKCQIPHRLVDSFFADANAYMSEAVTQEPSLKRKFLQYLNANTLKGLLKFLTIAESSEVALEAFAVVAQDWSKYDACHDKIVAPGIFVRLVTISKNITKLNLRCSTGLGAHHISAILDSPIRQTLEKVSLCDAEGLDRALLDMQGEFPVLYSLSVRHTMDLANSPVRAFVKLCPALAKLDLSVSGVELDVEADPMLSLRAWIPSSLRKLDIGFPRRTWRNGAFQELLQCDALAKLNFLGVGRTPISDLDVECIILKLDHLKSLDLCGCLYVTDPGVQVQIEKSTLSNEFQEVWLPSGAWFPVYGDREPIVISRRRDPRGSTFTFGSRGKTFAQTVEDRFGNREIRAHPREGMRQVHRELALDPVPMSVPLYTVKEQQSALTWGMGKGTVAAFSSSIGNFPKPFAHGASKFNAPAMLNVQFDFNEERWAVLARKLPPQNLVSSLCITRCATQEQTTLQFSPHGQLILNAISFPGVSPFVLLVAIMVTALKDPVASAAIN